MLAVTSLQSILGRMYYKSGMPQIVGEFDAEALHDRIDQVISTASRPLSIEHEIARSMDLPYADMDKIVGIKWRGFFRPWAFGSMTVDGEVDNITAINDQRGSIDDFHPDDLLFSRWFELPELLTTASRFPTLYVVGKIAVPRCVWQHPSSIDWPRFWSSDTGKEAISIALETGDVEPKHFNPGEVLRTPAGVLHRRDLPEGATGYRYFMKRFPKINTTHAGTSIGRLRPF